MRIAIIGNSHLAAYKLGWENIKLNYPNIECVFFGSPTTSMRALKVDSNTLVPTSDLVRENISWTSGGLDRISGDFDGYVLVGMGFSFVHLMAIIKSHRPKSVFDYKANDHQLISDAFFMSVMKATLHNSTGLNLVDKIKNITLAPLVYAPNPYPEIAILEDASYKYYLFDDLRSKIFNFYKQSFLHLADRGAVIFNQPEITTVDEMFTRHEYSQGSIKLKVGMASKHNDNDYFHMNADFGQLSLEGIFTKHFNF